MSIASDDLIALDTNALVHWIRQDVTGQLLLMQYALDQRAERPLLSTVVEGEMRALARYWNWGNEKLAHLDKLLPELVRVDPGHPDIVRAYADLHSQNLANGLGIGENDMWLAATAKVANAFVLTGDKHFLKIPKDFVRVEFVSPVK